MSRETSGNGPPTARSKDQAKPQAALVTVSEILPPTLPLIPVSQTSIFPGMIVPVVLPEGKLASTVEFAMEKGQGYVGVVLAKETASDSETVGTSPPTHLTGLPMERGSEASRAGASEFFPFGVAAKVLKRINLPDNQISILLTGIHRLKLNQLLSHDPHHVASVEYLFDEAERSTEVEAMLRSALGQFKQIAKDNPLISEEVKVALVNIDGPGRLADLMASVLVRDVESYQQFLAASDIKSRLQLLLLLLRKERDVQAVQKQIHDEISQKVASAQRDFYLQEQLKVIQRELGQSDDRSKITEKFRMRLKERAPSAEAKARIEEELEKLATLHEQSSEYSVCLNYVDWATSLPWGIRSEGKYSVRGARRLLDEDHYGLKEVKDRILEFLAVRKLKKSGTGTILCLVGPPGTGKTSLGKSIARVLGRKFYRFSVGGMRDEAEIKGHRRTYVGALPGKVIQGVKRAATQNPVFLIDEIDKMGSSLTAGGDPAAALLEVLDPEQNKEFLDHYLDIPFDCSDIFFITTANTTDSIPPALLDRMEVIHLPGYTDQEKFHIARKYLLPRQMERNALSPARLTLTDGALKVLIARYAREAGVRNLEKQIEKICRKVALRVATGKKGRVVIGGVKTIERYLGLPPYGPELGPDRKLPGVATGLAWTQFGGEVLYVEALKMPGKGGFVLTGQLGDVMQESANIAYSYVRDWAASNLKLPKQFFDNQVLHVHVPAGATPKDGPSAGVTMAASLVSLLSGKPLRPNVAMTGELTLTGRVLPVGGIKEKLLAARRAGVRSVVLPTENLRELIEIDHEIKKDLHIVGVSSMSECLRRVL